MKNKATLLIIRLISILMLISIQNAYASNLSLRPIKLPILERLSILLKHFQSQKWLQFIDRILVKSSAYQLVAYTLKSNAHIIKGTNCSEDIGNKDEFRVLTANMLLLPVPFFFNQTERIADFVNLVKIQNPDFIFLQEVWDKECVAKIIALLPDHNAVFKNSLCYNHSGLVILSKFPVRRAKAISYPLSLTYNLEEFIAQKGILVAQIELKNQIVNLVNTHLYSVPAYFSNRPNLAQMRHLINVISGLEKPVILGGDMNMMPEYVDKFLPEWLIRGNCSQNTAGLPALSQKLDYIMIAPTHAGNVEIEAFAIKNYQRFSDHIPVFAKIKFVTNMKPLTQ